jgi:hypothetical protein
MDPLAVIMAAIQLASASLAFETKVWDAMPPPVQATAAVDVATFNHNIATFLIGIQTKLKIPVA